MVMKNSKKNCKREEGANQIYLPKCCQQPRSRGSKPHTDFFPFVCSTSSPSPSSSPPNDIAADRLLLVPYHRRRRHRHRPSRGSVLEFSSFKDALPSITTTNMDQGCQTLITQYRKDIPERLFLNSVGVIANKDESVAQNTLSNTCDNRNTVIHKIENAETSDKSSSRATGSNDVLITPGSIVWAKTANRIWWPAEVMGERSSVTCMNSQDVNGYILVQYCGSHECAWVNPAEDLSEFEDCFEEKSCNPMESFQDALKQALHRKENTSSCRVLDESPDVQLDQSSEKWNASSSSRTEGEYLERGRGKRKRKPKVHFDVTFPMKSVKKLRRFRIMRYLGLTAPVGSPFSLTSHVRTIM
ncbi:uncharacterized protein LOC122065520 [Macadamia integrifolia]|uniref:uncharacterized protein LOC122065520 n=1 Tax=Macadamia integrifolia TaxID=60698 RepID=UPI001C4F2971|nr:uncharacterized protein LOC122065520 [Macadamia integrifolia]